MIISFQISYRKITYRFFILICNVLKKNHLNFVCLHFFFFSMNFQHFVKVYMHYIIAVFDLCHCPQNRTTKTYQIIYKLMTYFTIVNTLCSATFLSTNTTCRNVWLLQVRKNYLKYSALCHSNNKLCKCIWADFYESFTIAKHIHHHLSLAIHKHEKSYWGKKKCKLMAYWAFTWSFCHNITSTLKSNFIKINKQKKTSPWTNVQVLKCWYDTGNPSLFQ